MAETESTHEVAEKTDASGNNVRRETTRRETTTTEGTTSTVEVEGAPKQIQPDGR